MSESYFYDSEKPTVLKLCRELINKNRDQLSASDIISSVIYIFCLNTAPMLPLSTLGL